ncbi:hypothetical protein V4210_01585 [Candidatus Nanosynbacter sp. BB002]|uniref:hypothetical protein n=1 Tax=Candidatus Nanosynbacter sp. BB002 TaxID=3393757 RepID=UPI0030D3A89F
MENLTNSTHSEQATSHTIVRPDQTPPIDTIDPKHTIFEVTVKSFFSKKADEYSMRIGSVDDIQVLPQYDENTTSEETIVGVTLIAGDTGNHQPLLDRAGKKSSIFDMPKATGCTSASMSVTAEPGDAEYPNFSEVITGVEIPGVAGESPAELAEREQAAENFMRAVGEVAAYGLLGPFSELQEGFTLTVKPAEIDKTKKGKSYQTITVDSPDTAGKS